MKKYLLKLLVLTCICAVISAPASFAYVVQNGVSQKQEQTDLYAQQIDYLRQQTEYLRQQTEALKQQNEALKQGQVYNQGYMEGQKTYYHRDYYTPSVFVGGLATGYLIGHWPVYRHHCHHCW